VRFAALGPEPDDDGLTPLQIAAIVIAVVVVACLGAGCCHAPAPKVVEPGPCAVEAPPAPRPVKMAGPESGCPSQFVGCLDVPNALALEADTRAARRWQAEVWARCGSAR
jgi:hypothetical protein